MTEEKQFKDTLNLPKTTLAMRANAAIREVEIQKFWNEMKKCLKKITEIKALFYMTVLLI